MYRLIQASAHSIPQLVDNSVQLICTSPPYFGLRAYEDDQEVDWPGVSYRPLPGLPPLHIPGCDPECNHVWGNYLPSHHPGQVEETKWQTARASGHGQTAPSGRYCLKCHGWRGALGLEPDTAAYIGHLILCLREWRRILRPDGLCFVNLGTCYNGSGGSTTTVNFGKRCDGKSDDFTAQPRRLSGYKPKDLVPIPWLLGLAAEADGWWLRSDIIWHKENCKPESVHDRPTRAHEYVLLLAKSQHYFYDDKAVAEPGKNWGKRDKAHSKYAGDGFRGPDQPAEHGLENGDFSAGRNLRTVWSVNLNGFRGAHFATWPEALVSLMIKAGTPEAGCCAQCGKPYQRTLTNWQPNCSCSASHLQPDDLEIIATPTGTRAGDDPTMITGRGGFNRPRGENEGTRPITRYEQRCYAQQLRVSSHRDQMEDEAGTAFEHYIRTDKTGARPIPPELLTTWLEKGWLTHVTPPIVQSTPTKSALVLDPFCGSGTTLLAAEALGRDSIGVDIAPSYLDDLARMRAGMFCADNLPTEGE